MMAPNLSPNMITGIKYSLRKDFAKPPFYAITDAYNTTYYTVQCIYKKIRDIDLHRRPTLHTQRGLVVLVSLLIEEGIMYLVEKELWVY